MTFRPCWWLPNGHLQTCIASLTKRPQLATVSELIPLLDGDQLELMWYLPKESTPTTPTVMLLHGLEGSVNSPYIQGMLQQIKLHGWRGVVLHFRGSNGRANPFTQSYHAGKTEDLLSALRFIKNRYPESPCAAIGYSLGANVLLKFLGESPDQAFIQHAVAISPPFDLQASAKFIRQGINTFLYERHFMKKLKRSISKKLKYGTAMPFSLDTVKQLSHLSDFDELITAPTHGFKSAVDYYIRCSSHPFLRLIKTPTLIIHAEDDPIIPKEVIPAAQHLSKSIQMDVQKYGGHVGFISGGRPGKLTYWLEQRIPQYLRSYSEYC